MYKISDVTRSLCLVEFDYGVDESQYQAMETVM